MRHVDQIAFQPPQHGMALQEALGGIGRSDIECEKILWQGTYFPGLLRKSQQKVFVFGVDPRQRANDVACVRAHAELGHAPNVDGDLHYSDSTQIWRRGTQAATSSRRHSRSSR